MARSGAKPETHAHTARLEAEAARYRVLRGFALSDSHTAQPGEIIEASDRWPFHRARQMVEQGYLLPVSPSQAA